MPRFLFCVGLFAVLPACLSRPLAAGEKPTWQEAQLKKLSGRWTTVREETAGPDKVRRTRVDLEFADGKIKLFLFNEKGGMIFDGELRVIGVEEIKGVGLGPVSRLKLGGNELQKAEVHYDFVGEKLILVGRIGWRPYEGFALSGEYQRPEKAK